MTTLHCLPVAVTLLLAILVTSTSARQCRSGPAPRIKWRVNEFPNPQSAVPNDQLACCRQNISNVCDPNGIITEAQADQIDNAINDVYANTRCMCGHCTQLGKEHGYIIRVALMEDMQDIDPMGDNNTMGDLRDAHLYSYQLSVQWNMDGSCPQGEAETMLIMYVRGMGILFTLTREGARMKVSDQDIGTISMAVRHYFDNENTIADGLLEMIARYRLIFDNRHDEAISPSLRRTTG